MKSVTVILATAVQNSVGGVLLGNPAPPSPDFNRIIDENIYITPVAKNLASYG